MRKQYIRLGFEKAGLFSRDLNKAIMTVLVNSNFRSPAGEMPDRFKGHTVRLEGEPSLNFCKHRGNSFRGPAAGEGSPLQKFFSSKLSNFLDILSEIYENNFTVDQSAPLTLVGGFFTSPLLLSPIGLSSNLVSSSGLMSAQFLTRIQRMFFTNPTNLGRTQFLIFIIKAKRLQAGWEDTCLLKVLSSFPQLVYT